MGLVVSPSMITTGHVKNIRTNPRGSGPTFLMISGEKLATGVIPVDKGQVQSLYK